jgi:sortase A
MRRQRSWLYAAVPVTAAFFSLIFTLSAAWIPLKGKLAQWLIHRSWQQSSPGHPPPPPWPWADTATAAMLRAPAHDVRLYVLRGNSGRNLAFGPVLSDTWVGGMDRIISGHRDTHFRFLEDLRIGDLLHLTDSEGGRWFRVQGMDVVDSRTTQLVLQHEVERLSLVTCYPFDDPSAGGPLRYVVTAYAIDAAPRPGKG